MKNLEDIFELIPNYPALQLALITDETLKERDIFINLAKKLEASLYVKDLTSNAKTKDGLITVEPFTFESKRYNYHSILYDFIFLYAYIGQEDTLMIFKKIYRVLKNGANLFLFIDQNLTQEVMDILSKSNFVAINHIDEYQNLSIISAKKMHSWMKV